MAFLRTVPQSQPMDDVKMCSSLVLDKHRRDCSDSVTGLNRANQWFIPAAIPTIHQTVILGKTQHFCWNICVSTRSHKCLNHPDHPQACIRMEGHAGKTQSTEANEKHCHQDEMQTQNDQQSPSHSHIAAGRWRLITSADCTVSKIMQSWRHIYRFQALKEEH